MNCLERGEVVVVVIPRDAFSMLSFLGKKQKNTHNLSRTIKK